MLKFQERGNHHGNEKTSEVFSSLLESNHKQIQIQLKDELSSFHHKIIVLDDDPTGVQTVHGVSVYTDWTEESIKQGFREKNQVFFC